MGQPCRGGVGGIRVERGRREGDEERKSMLIPQHSSEATAVRLKIYFGPDYLCYRVATRTSTLIMEISSPNFCPFKNSPFKAQGGNK